jgi:hypothetical protein
MIGVPYLVADQLCAVPSLQAIDPPKNTDRVSISYAVYCGAPFSARRLLHGSRRENAGADGWYASSFG